MESEYDEIKYSRGKEFNRQQTKKLKKLDNPRFNEEFKAFKVYEKHCKPVKEQNSFTEFFGQKVCSCQTCKIKTFNTWQRNLKQRKKHSYMIFDKQLERITKSKQVIKNIEEYNVSDECIEYKQCIKPYTHLEEDDSEFETKQYVPQSLMAMYLS